MDNEIQALRSDNLRKAEKIASLESTVAQLKENNAMLAHTKDRETSELKREVVGFAEWIRKSGWSQLGSEQPSKWKWLSFHACLYKTTEELLVMYKESKTGGNE